MSESDWTWKFTQRAASQFEELDMHTRDRIVSKLTRLSSPNGEIQPITSNPSPAAPSQNSELASIVSPAYLIMMSSS